MSLSPPDVTVSIVNHANREEVLRCLEDLQAETGKSRIEIVVLDNDSHDGSVEAIRTRFPDVRVIAQRHTAGFGQNHNTIIRQSTGRYIFVLNDDARVGAAAIDELVEYLDARPRIAALGPKIVKVDGGVHASAWRFPSPAVSVLWAATLGLAGVVQSSGETPKPVDWVSGSALMLRRSALDSIGLFDPKIYMYMEETDLCKRIWDAGYEVCYYPPVGIVHRQYGSTFRIPERRTNEVWRSRRYYWRKHHSALGRIVARFFTGYRYFVGFALASLGRLLPRSARPSFATRENRRIYRLNARNAFLGPGGDGIWELAIERNSQHRDLSDKGAAPSREDPLVHRFTARTRDRGIVKAALVTSQVAKWKVFDRNGRQRAGLRIVYYHRISDDADELAVAPEKFKRQLDVVAQSGLEVVDLWSAAAEPENWDRPSIAITFDDGYSDFLENALPLLEEHGFPAMVFVIPLAVAGRAVLPWYGPGTQPKLIGWDEMRDVEARTTIRFEPHSLTHPRLPLASDAYAREEIAGSKAAVERELGRAARVFSYPGGYFSERDVALTREAGYAAAVTCEYGVNHSLTNPFMLRRTPVDRYDNEWLFRARLAGAADEPPPGIPSRAETNRLSRAMYQPP